MAATIAGLAALEAATVVTAARRRLTFAAAIGLRQPLAYPLLKAFLLMLLFRPTRAYYFFNYSN